MKHARMMATLLGIGATAGVAHADPIKQPTIPAAAAARIPEAGQLVAYMSDDGLVIEAITRKGVKRLYQDADASWVGDYYWTDPHTLVTLQVADDHTASVSWIVDGVKDTSRAYQVKPTDWTLPKGKTELQGVGLFLAKGELWLQGCTVPDDYGDECRKGVWMRVGDAAHKTVAKAPKGAARAQVVPSLAQLPKLTAPPAGYKAKLVKVKGLDRGKVPALECTGPQGKTVWSEASEEGSGERMRPDKVQWLLDVPALIAVEGKDVNPVGVSSREVWAFRGCAEHPFASFVWIGDGMWAARAYPVEGSTAADNWTVYVADQPVAIFPETSPFLPAPR